MTFAEMSKAVNGAKIELERADDVASQMARILEGRLRKVDSWTLKKLKREIAKFNMRTSRWTD
jgi:hypothetical protein